MNVDMLGSSGFRYLRVLLQPGEKIVTEAGAMASMDADVDLKATLNGGLLRAPFRRFLGGESLFLNQFQNTTDGPLSLVLTNPLPGEIRAVDLDGQRLCLQPGAFICATPGVSLGMRYAGIASFIAREGLFKLELSGKGTAWFGAFGTIYERRLEGELVVDSGHLVGYDPTVSLHVQLSSGLFGSLFSGEGFVTRLQGAGRVFIQTRSLEGMASWLNSRI